MSNIAWDKEIAWTIYEEDIKSWTVEKLVQELQLIANERTCGEMSEEGYNRAKEIVESQLIEQMNTRAQSTAYDAAMTGI